MATKDVHQHAELPGVLEGISKWSTDWQRSITQVFPGTWELHAVIPGKDSVYITFTDDKQAAHLQVAFASMPRGHLKRTLFFQQPPQLEVARAVRFFPVRLDGDMDRYGLSCFGDDLLELQFQRYGNTRAGRPMLSAATRGGLTAAYLRKRAADYPPTSLMLHLLLEIATEVEQGKDLQSYARGELDQLLARRLCGGPGVG